MQWTAALLEELIELVRSVRPLCSDSYFNFRSVRRPLPDEPFLEDL
jgi:hypothetical protein